MADGSGSTVGRRAVLRGGPAASGVLLVPAAAAPALPGRPAAVDERAAPPGA
ncbi:hypothetical protein [Streptomyces sp. NPDC001070]